LDEQIAALLHDMTHTAFSHVIDLVYRKELAGKSLHEQNVLEFVKLTDIPGILGRGWEKYFKEENWKLMEQPSPRLCADRGDYSPRDGVAFGETTPTFTRRYYASITNFNGLMAISSIDVARELCKLCIRTNFNQYNNPKGIGLYYSSAAALRRAVDIQYMSLKDFKTKPCQEVWDRLIKSQDKIIKEKLRMVFEDAKMNPNKTVFKLVEAGTDPPSKSAILLEKDVKIKPRYIDPLVKLSDEKALKISYLDQDLRERISALKSHFVDVYYNGP